MFFSVIIPIRNAEKFLKAAIDSVLNQKFSDYEIIVVDNASNDDGPAIIKAYQEKYPNIRYICHEQDRGLLQSRITGAKEARGEYLLNLDADDCFIGTDAFDILSKAIRDSGADIVQYNVRSDTDWGEWFKPIASRLDSSESIRGCYFCYPMRCSSMWSRAVKRSLYLSILPYIGDDLYLVQSEDVLQGALLMNVASSYKGIEQELYYYRMHPEGVSQKQNIKKLTINIEGLGLFLPTLSAILPRKCFDAVEQTMILHNMDNYKNILSNIPLHQKRLLWQTCFQVFSIRGIRANIQHFISTDNLSFIEGCSFPKCSALKEGRPHIAVVSSGRFHGGAEHVHSLLANYLYRAGSEIHFISVNCAWDQNFFPIDHGIPITVCPTNGEGRFIFWQDFCRKNPIDIFIIHDFEEQLVYLDILYLKLLNKKVICTIHTDHILYPIANSSSSMPKIRTIIYPICDALCCLHVEATVLWQNLGCRALYMPNILTFPKKITTSSLDSLNIIWVGRVASGKQCLKAVEAFHKAQSQCSENMHLYILGVADDAEKAVIDRYISQHNLNKQVTLTGHVQIVDYLQNASIHLLTSKSESFSMVLAETKAHGIPTIMFELPKIAMADTEGLVSVPQNDTDAMAEEIIRLVNSPELRKKMGQEALESLEPFQTEKTMQRWENLITAIADNSFDVNHPLAKVEANQKIISCLCHDISIYMQSSLPIDSDLPIWVEPMRKFLQVLLPPHSLRRKIVRKCFFMTKKVYRTLKR